MQQPEFGRVDLTDCDREPIRVPGSIQPHGLLLALDPVWLTVAQMAGDSAGLLGVEPAALLGRPLSTILSSADIAALEALVSNDLVLPRPFFALVLSVGGQPFNVTAHLSDGLVVLEFEPASDHDTPNAVELVQRMLAHLQGARTLRDLTDAIAREVQAVTGFDRVMVYQFKPDDSGHVVAETRRTPKIASFLDLHYPASDIPVQARELYRSNWIRSIPDARYQPAPLHPQNNPLTGRPLDLSFSALRSVSPLHLEYLQNMGVTASTSLSLVIGGRLWGLVACHHHAPLHLGTRIRAACELFAQLASLQLQSLLELEERDQAIRAGGIHNHLVRAMSRTDLPDSLLDHHPDLLDLAPAAGVALSTQGRVTVRGATPSVEQITALCAWLQDTMDHGVYATDRLPEVYPPAAAYADRASGLLALSITRDPRDFVLWFLPEEICDVTWAGEPAKAVSVGPLGDRLTPRKSFEAWVETVRGRSRPWDTWELEAAENLRTAILEVVLQRMDQVARERELARVQQDLLMAELDHRVKNTLATIQALVRFSGRTAVDLESFVASVERRLHSMGKAHNLLTASRWERASLRTLVEEELAPHRPAGSAGLNVTGEEVHLDPRTALSLSLALHELTTNAVKYGALSVAEGGLDVGWTRLQQAGGDWLVLQWREHGGPAVAFPSRKGFGRTLLERVLGPDVDGRVVLEFLPEGVTCRLEIPVTRLVGHAPAPVEPRAAAATPSEAPGGLAGVRVFFVEDGGLVAVDMADLLREAGAVVLGPHHTLEAALAAVDTAVFDMALLDVDINGQAVWPLAEVIAARDIPLVLATGFAASVARPAAFVHATTISKPYDTAIVFAAIARAVTQRQHAAA